jgi:outer membrane protein TolC
MNRSSFQSAVLCALVALAAAGCTRKHYRCQADREVFGVVASATSDPRFALDDFTIQPSAASRMYDPDNPDHPPMPPDDPQSHALMHCVDGKRGWKYWHRNGDTPYVENPMWRTYLPKNSEGLVVLDRQGAMQLALLNSREYQRSLEELYLSALEVTFQRFRFDTQFFGGTITSYEADGPLRNNAGNSQSILEHQNNLSANKLFATGGELVVGLANSLVWQFSGPDTYQANTLLNFALTQPLLRAGGRAVVLEHLTQSERILLANIRQMEQFRRGFYTQIVAGRAAPVAPARGGVAIPAVIFPSGSVGGFLGLLGSQIRIRNQRVNVAVVQTNLDQLQAFFEAGRLQTSLQVEQARQALLDAQSQLLDLEASYQNQLDSFKILMGLPPDLEIRIEDSLLNKFDLITPAMTDAQKAVSGLAGQLRQKTQPLPKDYRARFASVRDSIRAELEEVRADLENLGAALPSRRKNLELLANREEVRSGSVYPAAYSAEALDRRAASLAKDYPKLAARIAAALDALERAAARLDPAAAARRRREDEPPDPVRQQLTETVEQLSDLMLQLSLIQAAARLDAVPLTWVDLGSEEAFGIARANRPDWMNARAALVDTWRQIEVTANALMAGVSVTFSGDINTVNNNPLEFRGSTGQLRAQLQFDAPLTRLAERNVYRTAQIAYEQARHQYYAFEDLVNQILRAELRDIRLSQLDFEMRRAAVLVAIIQLDLTRLSLVQPPKPGETSLLGATTARDLLQASSALLSAQNAFLTAWLNYEVQRMNLDFDLGTMRLDDRGMWIDPGPIESGHGGSAEPEEVNLPEPAAKSNLQPVRR